MAKTTHTTHVIHKRQLAETAWELRLDRPRDFTFAAGELITLFGRDQHDQRDYTICSGIHDPWLDVLFRLVPHGALTPQLCGLKTGDPVKIAGPYGTFTLQDATRPSVFIATGTGIAPARALIRSHPQLNMDIVHGVREAQDLFYAEEFASHPYWPCVSGQPNHGFHGRVTEFLAQREPNPNAHYYLCGANEMIYAVGDLLAAAGIGLDQQFTEPYYYRSDD